MHDGTLSFAPLPAAVEAAGVGTRIRHIFGPALVGLVGGGLSIGIGLDALGTLLQNVASTYAKYPSLQTPWLARNVSMPSALLVSLFIVGFTGPLAMGLASAWLVRSKDAWGDVSAGLTTGLTGGLAAYLAGIGWAVTLALVIVPSISDYTLFGNATKAPAQANKHPSDVLVERYPDLLDAPADERGALFFPKMVSDQVIGSAYSVWLGVGLSLGSVGLVGFCGTLAGGWLLRRGGSWRSIVVPYGELTVSTAFAAGRLAAPALGMSVPSWFAAASLVAATALVVTGVVRRWPWLLRVTLALTWILVLTQVGQGNVPWPLAVGAYLAYGILVFLLVRHWLLRTPQRAAAV